MQTARFLPSINKSTNVRNLFYIQNEFSFFYTDSVVLDSVLLDSVVLHDGREATLRPLRPEDEAAHREFAARLSPTDLRQRFFRTIRGLPAAQWWRLIHIDYRRDMAFIATAPDDSGRSETLGVARMVMDADWKSAEIALIVRSDLKRLGLGQALFGHMLRYCRERGVRRVFGTVLPDNTAMLALARKFGMRLQFVPGERVVALGLEFVTRHLR